MGTFALALKKKNCLSLSNLRSPSGLNAVEEVLLFSGRNRGTAACWANNGNTLVAWTAKKPQFLHRV